MTNNRSLKRALLASIVSLILCFTMLLGTTYAWFTDSVTNSGNKIVAGTLDVELHMNADGNGYVNISDNTKAIFGEGSIAQNNNAETLWEPGKTQVAYLMIKNNGNLALKYNVALKVYDSEKDLYKVMEYVITPDAKYGDVTAWDDTNAKTVQLGTQTVSNGEGFMKPGDEHYFALSIHMLEDAGNDYMEGKISFDITVLAAQLNSEEDSFGSSYDIGAEYDDNNQQTPPTPPTVTVFSAADLQAALTSTATNSNGKLIVNLASDVQLAAGETWTPLNIDPYAYGTVTNIVINGNGHTISGLNGPLLGDVHFGGTSVEINGLTIKDAHIDNQFYNNGISFFVSYADNVDSVKISDCHVIDSEITNAPKDAGAFIGYVTATGSITDCTVENVTISGAKSAGALVGFVSVEEITVTDCSVNNVTLASSASSYRIGKIAGSCNGTLKVNTTTITNVTLNQTASTEAGATTSEYVGRNYGTVTVDGVAQ